MTEKEKVKRLMEWLWMLFHRRWMVEEVFVTNPTEVNFLKKNKDKYYAIILGDSAFVPTQLYRKALKEMKRMG